MRLSVRTIGKLKEFVTGDNGLTPYRSGPALVRFFNEHGCNESYPTGGGFPSRHAFAEDKLKELNGRPVIAQVLEAVFDPLDFEGTDKSVQEAIEAFNPFLDRDGYALAVDGSRVSLRRVGEHVVAFEPSVRVFDPDTLSFVLDNADKCRRKLRDGDLRGAITNARSLVEDVLVGLERKLSQVPPQRYNGDLPQLFKRVRKLLKMEADTYRSDADLFVMLNGLTGVVDGLASFSNRAGDRHAGTIQPARHHAVFIVNAVSSLCTFLVESAELQIKKTS